MLLKSERTLKILSLISVVSLLCAVTLLRKPSISSSSDKSPTQPPHQSLTPSHSTGVDKAIRGFVGLEHTNYNASSAATTSSQRDSTDSTNTSGVLSSHGTLRSADKQEVMRDEQMQRRSLVNDVCRRLNMRPWSTKQLRIAARHHRSMLVNDEQRFIYCRVPKVASTTWLRVLLVASGKVFTISIST